MALRFLQQTTAILALLSPALAQTPDIIPPDLSAGFTDEQVQVSFSNNAVTGFASGTTFPAAAVSNEPTFALGDSNGISPLTLYTLLMVDTTCRTRTLHYVRSNFKFAFAGGTNIETQSAPLLDYKPPGAFQEKGEQRQYAFLMYENPQRAEIREMRLPAEGEAFDVKTFQADNRLNDPVAGVGMVVQLGGTADCEGGDARPLPTGLPSAAPASSSTLSRASVSSSAAERTESRSSASAPAQTVTSASATSAASASPSSSALSGSEDGQGTSPSSAIGTQVPEPSSSVLQTDDTAPTMVIPTATLTNVRATVTGSETASGGPVEQTANAASDVRLQGVFVAPMVVVAGVLVW